MANIVQLKRSSVANKVPLSIDLEVGEPVVNLTDKILYTKDGSGTVIVVGAGTTSNITEGVNLYFSNARVSTAVSSQTLVNATFSGNVISSGNVKANYYLDGSGRRLLIKDSTGAIVWGE